MDQRQAYALANPMNHARSAPDERLCDVRRHARGFHIRTVLAVDR